MCLSKSNFSYLSVPKLMISSRYGFLVPTDNVAMRLSVRL